MNTAELKNKLIAAARLEKPDDRVPYAFEKRIAALIAARSMVERSVSWTRGLWRAALSCVAVAILLGTLSFFLPSASDNGDDLSQDFENTMLASLDQSDTAP